MIPTLWLLVGLSASANLGERPGLLATALLQTRQMEADVSFDTSDKYTGAGWIATGSVDWQSHGVLLGAEYRYRDGGPWHKQQVWLRTGATLGAPTSQLRLVVRVPLWASLPPTSTVCYAEYRRIVNRIMVSYTSGLVRYRQPDWRLGVVGLLSVGAGI